MRQLLFIFLRFMGAWNKLRLRLRGTTAQEYHARRVISGKSWADYCDRLKLAGQVLLSAGVPDDPMNRAEGIRHLSRLTRAGLEAYVEYGDPLFPVFRRMVHETVKMGADNPDNYYLNAQISGEMEYLIRGRRNTVDYISFHTQNGNYGTTGGLAPCGKLDDRELVLDEDGSFEICLSREPKGRNWLKTETDTSLVMVRQTFADRHKEIPAQLEIINLSAPEKPGPLTPESLDEGLESAAMLVAGAPLLFTRWAKGFKKHVNTLPRFDPDTSDAAGGDPSIVYYHSYWRLKAEEALLIEVDPPECDAWNFQLNNFWMESLDYRYHTVCINKAGAVYDPGGRVRLVVAHTDPGLPNWIETASHQEGTMSWRWYRIHEGAEPVQPVCTLVRLKDIRKA